MDEETTRTVRWTYCGAQVGEIPAHLPYWAAYQQLCGQVPNLDLSEPQAPQYLCEYCNNNATDLGKHLQYCQAYKEYSSQFYQTELQNPETWTWIYCKTEIPYEIENCEKCENSTADEGFLCPKWERCVVFEKDLLWELCIAELETKLDGNDNWICPIPQCNARNPLFDDQCYLCSYQRVDWNWMHCTMTNLLEDKIWAMCGLSRTAPDMTHAEGTIEWEYCTFVNEPNTKKCEMCKKKLKNKKLKPNLKFIYPQPQPHFQPQVPTHTPINNILQKYYDPEEYKNPQYISPAQGDFIERKPTKELKQYGSLPNPDITVRAQEFTQSHNLPEKPADNTSKSISKVPSLPIFREAFMDEVSDAFSDQIKFTVMPNLPRTVYDIGKQAIKQGAKHAGQKAKAAVHKSIKILQRVALTQRNHRKNSIHNSDIDRKKFASATYRRNQNNKCPDCRGLMESVRNTYQCKRVSCKKKFNTCSQCYTFFAFEKYESAKCHKCRNSGKMHF